MSEYQETDYETGKAAAENLAHSLWVRFYRDEKPDWVMPDSLHEIINGIYIMTSGLIKSPEVSDAEGTFTYEKGGQVILPEPMPKLTME